MGRGGEDEKNVPGHPVCAQREANTHSSVVLDEWQTKRKQQNE